MATGVQDVSYVVSNWVWLWLNLSPLLSSTISLYFPPFTQKSTWNLARQVKVCDWIHKMFSLHKCRQNRLQLMYVYASSRKLGFNSWVSLNKGWPTRWHLLYYILLKMFQTLIRPSSGACDYLLRCVGWLEACWCYVAGLSVGDVVSECRLHSDTTSPTANPAT